MTDKQKGILKGLWKDYGWFVISLLLIFTVTRFIHPVQVSGESMYPTLKDGQYLVGTKARNVNRGDICVIDTDELIMEDGHEGKKLIKRVIGIPGDTISIEDGHVILNGEEIDEPYVKKPSRNSLKKTVLKEDEYFFMGDNRNNSYDSRDFGPVPESSIVLKVCFGKEGTK